MYTFHPYFTNDGSVGLFSPEACDIYHSTYGALSEAYEKFILPADFENFFNNHNEIKVLDICYGIGYNTKSFLNFLIEKKIINLKKQKNQKEIFSDNRYIVSIDTNNTITSINNAPIDSDNITTNEKIYSDNIMAKKADNNLIRKSISHQNNIAPVYSNNISIKESACVCKNKKIFIKAIDTDEKLFYLSPFFKQGNKNDKKYNKLLDFKYEKILKLLNNNFSPKYTLKPEVNLIILKNILEKQPEIVKDEDLNTILNSSKYLPFFDVKMTALFWTLKHRTGINNPTSVLNTFLHNIYYKYLSSSYKRVLNTLKTDDFIFEPSIEDARVSLKHDNNIYNFIFLDAFTPAKCPALWSVDFFKLLFEHLDADGMILTYSNSSAVRNAMLNAGFFVGKIYNDEIAKYTGSVAVKNKSLIKHELSEYDLGLINSRAGIFYRDENLILTNEAIIETHKKEVFASNKISSSAFIKKYKNKYTNG